MKDTDHHRVHQFVHFRRLRKCRKNREFRLRELDFGRVKGLFRPHYVTWSEQLRIESHGSNYFANIVRINIETGLRIYKELMPMRKENVDLENAVVWIPDSKTPSGIAEIFLTPLTIQAFQRQIAISGDGPFLFSSERTLPDTTRTFGELGREHWLAPKCLTFGSMISAQHMRHGGAPEE